jgi:hypothetical protein
MSGLTELLTMAKELSGEVRESFFPPQNSMILPSFEQFCLKQVGYSLYPEQIVMTDWFFKAMDNKNGEISLLLAMRKIGKSDLLTCCAVSYAILKNEDLRILICTKSIETQKTIMGKIRDIIEQYKKPIKQNDTRIVLSRGEKKDPNILCTIVGGRLRGAHPDVIICDDIQDEGDESPAERKATQRQFNKLTGLSAKSIICIGQLAHEECLYSRLRTRKEVNKKEIWYTDISQALKHAINLESLDKVRVGATERYIGHNYLGYHLKDSDKMYFNTIAVTPINDWPTIGVMAFLDPAFDGADSIGLAIGYYFQTGSKLCFAAHVKKLDFNVNTHSNIIIDYLINFSVQTLYIEKTGNNGLVRDIFEKDIVRRNLFIHCQDINANINKQKKIFSNLLPMRDTLFLDADGDYKEVTEWTDDDEHDDAIDALASLIMVTQNNRL